MWPEDGQGRVDGRIRDQQLGPRRGRDGPRRSLEGLEGAQSSKTVVRQSQNQDLRPPETVRWPMLGVGNDSEARKKWSTEVRESIEVRKAKSKERLLVKTGIPSRNLLNFGWFQKAKSLKNHWFYSIFSVFGLSWDNPKNESILDHEKGPKDRQEGVDGRIQDDQRGPRRSWDGPQRGLAALKAPKMWSRDCLGGIGGGC